MWIPLGSQLLSSNSNWLLKLFPQEWLCKGCWGLHLSSLIKDKTVDKPWTATNWKLTVSLTKSLLTRFSCQITDHKWVLQGVQNEYWGHTLVKVNQWESAEKHPSCKWCLNIHNVLRLSTQHLKLHRCCNFSYHLGHEIAGEIGVRGRGRFQRTCHPAQCAVLFSESAT